MNGRWTVADLERDVVDAARRWAKARVRRELDDSRLSEHYLDACTDELAERCDTLEAAIADVGRRLSESAGL